jgi:hypothetical protein
MRELIGKIPTKDLTSPKWSISLRWSAVLIASKQCLWVSRWSRSKKTENPRRLCGTCATAADMVLITKRRRKVCLFGPILDRKRCSVSAIQSGA